MNLALTLVLIRRTELTPKKLKIPKPIQKLLKEYDDIISKESHDLGQTSVIEYKINLVYPFPIRLGRKLLILLPKRRLRRRLKGSLIRKSLD